MAHSLTDLQIARLVGAQAFSRGENFAQHGHVGRIMWAASGIRVFATITGSGRNSYVASVSFHRAASGELVNPVGSCTCPVGSNCKHVAALLIASRAGKPGEEGPEVRGADAAAAGSPTAVTAEAGGPAASSARSWQKALAPLTANGRPIETGSPLALQFELRAPERNWRAPADPLAPPRLGVRPMTLGTSGRWIKGNLSWQNLGYSGGVNLAQRAILTRIHDECSRGTAQQYSAGEWLHLEAFPSPALWSLLQQASAAGIALISSSKKQDPVALSGEQAELSLDITRGEAGLTMTPSFSLGERPLDARTLILLGNPAHGIASWTAEGASKHSSAASAPPTEVALTLARLSAPIGPALRELAAAGTALVVPPSDEKQFLAEYYPHLRAQLSLSSSDGSFELAAVPEPHLVLSVTSLPDARIQLGWHWRYLTGGSDAGTTESEQNVAFVRTLHAGAGQPGGYRNAVREQEILGTLRPVLERFPALAEAAAPAAPDTARLAESSTLAGSAMLDFLATAVPELEAGTDISVHFSEALPEYREAAEPPLITLATHERPDDRDWFDLAVEITVDGEKIPFDDLFRALAGGQDVMILQNGIWFSLDRPELQQLRTLIAEARSLQEPHAHGLGISRFQTELWQELVELGVVGEQAEAWRETVEGLASGAAITARALPETVHAQLRPYQQQGFEWLSFIHDSGLGGVLADDMGLGKTLQVIALIAEARRARPGAGTGANADAESGAGGPASAPPFLVIAPTSVVPNWAAECARFAPSLTVVAITATSSKRSGALAAAIAGADVVISSYTLFRLDFEEYDRQQWAGLLLDEAQFVKNHQSRAHQCARRLRAPFKLAITGTPLENNLMELWSLFSITAPGLFPSPSTFGEYYQRAIERDGDEERLAQLRRRIRPFMLRRTKDEVATDLPEKQEQVLELELHPKHRKVYETHLQRERQKVLGLIEDMNTNRFEIFRSLTMLRQLSLDASLYDEKYSDVPSTKLDALLEMLDDTVAEGHRTLIFSQFTGYLAKARARLDDAGIAYSYLDGSTRNRAKTIAEFKDGTNPVFLISLKAGGFGLNLTEADYVILLDPWWNPATEAQAVDRTHRIGQTKNVMVYRLVSKDTIEEKVMAMKATKAKLFDSVMTEGTAPGAKLSAADIRELLE
jgi:superfamily II DNA or RNA helicase